MSIYDPTKKPVINLKAEEKTRPNHYVEAIEKAGMVIDAQTCIAMYTAKAGVNQGPPGPPGEDQNSWFDTIIASASDEVTPLTIGSKKTTFRAPYPLDLTQGYVRASLSTAPQGIDLIVDITVNGFPLFTTPIHIENGSRTSVGAATQSVIDPARLLIPDDAEFLVNITQVGDVYAGAGLKVAVTGIKTD